ncbi:hypothetical protein H5410_016256 [Solanum commersonii]|uniref:Uncharacterized protein n=1 Tax=Solanum commersonii TaxID=4109 RepID=A0A9J5ZW28_SOLCO|nr:hypothetical protein H5410_016256 [Solanum commersonii]
MNAPLEAVRDRKTGDLLFYEKSHPPFKTDPLRIGSQKSSFVDVITSKNEPMTTSNVKNEVAAQQVMLNFGDNYGYIENYQCLEENVPFANHRNTERSKRLGELAVAITTLEILEDIRSLSKDVYKLSSTEDMLNQFEQQNLF